MDVGEQLIQMNAAGHLRFQHLLHSFDVHVLNHGVLQHHRSLSHSSNWGKIPTDAVIY